MKLFRSLRVFFSPVAFIRLIRSATSIRKYPTMSTRSIDLQALRMALLRQLSSSGDAQFVVGRVVTPSYFASSAFNFCFFYFVYFDRTVIISNLIHDYTIQLNYFSFA